MNTGSGQKEPILNRSELLKYFYEGFKPQEKFKVGLEFEKIGVYSSDFTAARYSGSAGIKAFIDEYYKTDNFSYISEDGNILGLHNRDYEISLEPGSQFEISTAPKKTVHDIAEEIKNYNKKTSLLAENFGIKWLGYGIQPLSTYENIELIPKKRYQIMTEYLPGKGNSALVMMRETAGIQTAVDHNSEEDAYYKLRTFLGLSPIVTAMFANSPIRKGKESGYKSYRAFGWLNTDERRCGYISSKIFEENFGFEDYVDVLLDLPMVFLKKDNKWVNMQGISFREYLDKGFEGYVADIDDWLMHRTSFFPEVRLNSYLEIRNCDCQRADLIPAIPALWKGIAYDNDAMNAAWELVKDFSWEERQNLRREVTKYALDTPIGKLKVLDLAKELVNIADFSLKKMKNLNAEGDDESIYLERVKELLSRGYSPADEILELLNNSWKKDLSKLIDYVRL